MTREYTDEEMLGSWCPICKSQSCVQPHSMDDLPPVPPERRFAHAADLAELIVPPCDGVTLNNISHAWAEGEAIEYDTEIIVLQPAQWGVLLRWGSVWIGAHWSPTNRRLCINLIPFVTLWFTARGGTPP